jgi:hypothetical protein
MKSDIKERASWTGGRFLGMVGVLLVLQAGLLFLFGDRSRPQPPRGPPAVRFRVLGASVNEDQLLRQYFVGDPAVFPLPNRHGFSGRGWMDQRPVEFQSEKQLESPIWLTNDTARLGTNFPVLASASEPILSDLVGQQSRYEEPLPLFLGPEMIATQSVFRLELSLSNRLRGTAPVLRSWASPQLLTNSTVQIAVDPAGEVIATRLDARCGLPEADADALAKARALRFRPAPAAGTRWGEAVFQWQTTEPAAAGPVK